MLDCSGKNRRCALCQQRFGSGLQDNVPAVEVLRARRMLMERSTGDDGPTSQLIREGFDQFLDDLTREREALDVGQRNMPLDVCVFCVQFLPSSYNMPGDADEEQRAQTPMNCAVRATPPSSRAGSCCTSGGRMRSSLVVQHQFPAALGKSPRTARVTSIPHRPQSCSQPSPSYRLLSNDATRVLRIESPAAALNSMSTRNGYDQHRGLLTVTDDVMGNLRVQEQHQLEAILRTENSKREMHYQRRLSTAKQAQQTAREHSECRTGVVDSETPQRQNIIDALMRGAGTLYTGVAVHQENNALAPTPRTSVTAKSSKIVTKKHGRHFKTELFFPAIPVTARAPPKK